MLLIAASSASAVELPGTISVDAANPAVLIPADGAQTFPSSKLRWSPHADVQKLLTRYLREGLRCRIGIKGETIFSLDGAVRAYLDGKATTFVGKRAAAETARTAQSFPSGIGERASDFESWFFLQSIPTLLKVLPGPPRRVIGDLSKVDKVLHGLDLT